MAVVHRALATWFVFLALLVFVCLRLESRILWNWFIVFIPMWVYDYILLTYVVLSTVTHWRNRITELYRGSVNKHIWYIAAILLKLAAEILLCVKLEYPQKNLPIYVVMTPIWLLLPFLCIEVFMHLIKSPNGNGRF